ncbi:MAG TPA: Hint domain-containing protein [Acetobacteraceae bacterium]|nr:Hint domain-containing protein [Acetobacteraceae bacterium]
MAGSTWTWLGGTGSGDVSSNWTLTAGSGNGSGVPEAGDTAINAGGTILLTDPGFTGNTVELGGTAGVAALFGAGDTATTFMNPSFDGNTLLTSAVPGNATAETSLLDAAGMFINEGTILADGPTGSSFTIDISGTMVGGTFQPGYFINYSQIEVDAGNAMTITVAGTSELFNAGEILVNGGSLFVNVASNAVAGGYAGEAGAVVIVGGGTVETNAGYPSNLSGFTPTYAFADATAGNTLKIDNIGSFGGGILGFGQNDTIDAGTSLAVGQVAYSSSTGILNLENAGGTILASLLLSSGNFQNGTFAVAGGVAGSFNVGTGADGNTVLTTGVLNDAYNNGSGAWQTGSLWSNGTPGTLDTAIIGFGASSPFTLTTGIAAVSVGKLVLASDNALLQITSNTTASPYAVAQFGGTVEVTSGNTLTASAYSIFHGTAEVDPNALLDLTGHPSYATTGAINGTITVNNTGTNGLLLTGGTLLVNGGTLDAGTGQSGGDGGKILIGYEGGGTPAAMTVQNSGANAGVVTDTYSILGSDPTSFGILTLNGNVSWTDQIDPHDTVDSRGFMLVGYNGLVGTTGTAALPPFTGTATLTVENGATLTEQTFAQIGSSIDSAGSVLVSNGLWNIGVATGGYLDVGLSGAGALTVTNSGTVDVGNVGTFLSNGTTYTAEGIGVGYSLGSSGTLTVENSGVLLDAGGVSVGSSGQGTLEVLNGGTVAIAGTGGHGVGVGVSASATGLFVVSGTASVVTFGTASTGMGVGQSGQGTLEVLNGGTVSIASGGHGIGIGKTAGASGTVLVSGTASVITLGTATTGIGVGQAGQGLLEVMNGGTVSVSSPGYNIGVGEAAGSSGTVLVSGTDALLTLGSATTRVEIGVSGQALFDIENGATANIAAGAILIGVNASAASGTVVVSGSGALLTLGSAASGGLNVGLAGSGLLEVGSGGTVAIANDGTTISAGVTTVTSDALNIGQDTGSTGTVTVTGAGALLTAASAVHVGAAGHGVLDVLNGGSFVITNTSIGNLDLGGSGNGPEGGTGTVAVSGGGNIEADTGLFIWAGSTLSVDASSGIDLGTSGTYAAGAIDIESGHALIGAGLIEAAVVNSGEIAASNAATLTASTGGTLEITGAVSGTGGITLAAGSTLKLDGLVSGSQSVTFATAAGAEALVLGAPQTTNAFGIANWQYGDEIVFAGGATVTGAHWLGSGTLAVDSSAGTMDFTNVGLAGGVLPNFTTGSDFVELVLCFVAGTHIATPTGEVPVERLSVGDTVLTHGGEARPITWIGTGRVLATRGRRNAATPVIVRKGALADNVPHRDLHVTKGHSLYLDGVLIPVEFLVNHRSILWDDRAQEVALYHIELGSHDVLIANGAPAESYRDDGNRWLFQNANNGWEQPPKPPCAPVLTGGAVIDRVWRRLLDRAGPRPGLLLTEDPELHLLVDGDRLNATSSHGGAHIFRLPAGPEAVRVVSRAGAPAELGVARDPRVLGVALRRIAVRQGTRFRVMEAADPSLADGFHAFEPDNGLRWTDGDAALPRALFEGFGGPMELVLHVGGTTSYLADYPVRRVA